MAWLTGWTYRKEITITGSTGGAQTNYSIPVTINYGSGTDSARQVYLSSNCETDFGDIRFTQSDGSTELDYFLDQKIDSDKALFWFEANSIPASPSTATFYVYYGKTGATTTSNGENTFQAFEGFESGTYDFDVAGSVGVTLGNSTSYSPKEGSYVGVNSGSQGYKKEMDDTASFDTNYIGGAWCKVLSGGGTNENLGPGITMFGATGGVNDGYEAIIDQRGAVSPQVREAWDYGSRNDGNYATSTDTWYFLTLEHSGTQAIAKLYTEAQMYTGTPQTTTTKTDSTFTSGYYGIGTYNANHSAWDSARVRKYVTPEPAITAWGSEESGSSGISVNVSDSITTTENVAGFMTLLRVSSNDSITVTDGWPGYHPEEIGVTDSGSAETGTLATGISINTSDSITLTESTSITSASYLSSSESITLTDSSTVLITRLYPSANEGVTITESSTVRLRSFVSASDSIALTENTTARINYLNVSASDAINATESVDGRLSSFISTNDGITTTESVTTLINTLYIDSNDQITSDDSPTVAVGDSPPINLDIYSDITLTDTSSILIKQLYNNVSDTITLSESSSTVINQLYINVADDITATENTDITSRLYISQSDDITLEDALPYYHPEEITVSESASATIVGVKAVNVSDDITLTESVSVFLPILTPESSESISITEDSTALLTSYVNASDSITLSESVTVSISAIPAIDIDVFDDLTTTDSPTVLRGDAQTLAIDLYDDIALSENTTVLIKQLYVVSSDDLTVSEGTSRYLTSYIDQSDDITITEDSTAQPQQLYIDTPDEVTISENTSHVSGSFISVSDEITVTESSESQQAGALNISVYDDIGQRIPRLIVRDGALALRVGGRYHISI